MAVHAFAAALPVPSVEYSADRHIESAAGAITSKVFSAKGKERTETNMHGMRSVVIIRQDKQIGWMLLPAQKMYQTLDFAQAAQQSQPGAVPSDNVTFAELGTETVEGFKTTKFRMTMKDNSAEGLYWISEQGIPVKMEMNIGAARASRNENDAEKPEDRQPGSAAVRASRRLSGHAGHE